MTPCSRAAGAALIYIFTGHADFSQIKKVNEMLDKKGLTLARPLLRIRAAW